MTEANGPGLNVHPDPVALADAVADLIEEAAANAIRERGVYHLVLSGGSTPRLLYRIIDRPPREGRIDWSRTHIWFGDERCVPPGDVLSNYRLADQALLSRVDLAENAIHRIHGEAAPEEAAARYEAEIRAAFGDEPVRFDLILLGMGNDGHTASIFPSMPNPAEETRLVVPARAPTPPHDRVTLSLRAINAAREIAFLVAGAEKAESLGWVLMDHAKGAEAKLPASLVRPEDGRLQWVVDRAATPFLTPRDSSG